MLRSLPKTLPLLAAVLLAETVRKRRSTTAAKPRVQVPESVTVADSTASNRRVVATASPAKPAPETLNAFERAIQRASPRVLWPLYQAFGLWSKADGLRMSAAMSFYGILSLAPLLVLLVAVLGFVLSKTTVETAITQQLSSLLGTKVGEVVTTALSSAQQPSEGFFASAVAFVFLMSGATGVFAELQTALQKLWHVGTEQPTDEKWWASATLRLKGLAYVFAFGFLMLVSLAISSWMGMAQTWLGERWHLEWLVSALNQLLSFALATGMFYGLMRLSSKARPRDRHLWLGAALSAALFTVGKTALAAYLSNAAAISAYGAAGSLVALLMWIYFACAVLLFGAALAKALDSRAKRMLS